MAPQRNPSHEMKQKELEKLETAFMVVFWNAILKRLNKVSIQIQSSSVDVLTVSDLYGSLVDFTMTERENFDYFEEKAIEMRALKQYQGEIKSQPKRKEMMDEISNE